MSTYSQKNVVATDQFLTSNTFVTKSEEEKLELWRWARSSKEIERRFIDNVKISQRLAVVRREVAKKKKAEKRLRYLINASSMEVPSQFRILNFFRN